MPLSVGTVEQNQAIKKMYKIRKETSTNKFQNATGPTCISNKCKYWFVMPKWKYYTTPTPHQVGQSWNLTASNEVVQPVTFQIQCYNPSR